MSVLVRFTKCPPSSNMNVRQPSHGDLRQNVVLSELESNKCINPIID